MDGITLELVTRRDIDRVIDFLKKSFYRDEPLNDCIDLVDPDGNCADLEKFARSAMQEGLSVMALDRGKIIGAAINGTCSRDEFTEDEEKFVGEKFRKIIGLLETVGKLADVFATYPLVDKVMEIKVMAVDGECRGRGIVSKLIEKTREIAKQNGCDLIRADCTGHYSARAMAKYGFEQIYELKYTDYKVDGLVVFEPKPPHTSLKVYIYNIK